MKNPFVTKGYAGPIIVLHSLKLRKSTIRLSSIYMPQAL